MRRGQAAVAAHQRVHWHLAARSGEGTAGQGLAQPPSAGSRPRTYTAPSRIPRARPMTRRSWFPALALSLACMLLVPAALAQPAAALPAGMTQVTSVEGITEYRLANGLQVLLVPDDSKPTTTVNMTYHVGSRHENYGETGMAHLLEHLMFKGTPTHAQGLGRVRPSAACAPTAAPRSTAPTTSPASRPTTTTCAGTWAGRPTRWSTASSRARPRHRDDGGAQRIESRREHARAACCSQRDAGRDVRLAQLRQGRPSARAPTSRTSISRACRRSTSRYYQPDNATLIVSGKFDTAQGAGLGGAGLRPAAAADAQVSRPPTRWTRRRTASARSPCAASAARRWSSWATTCRPARTPTSPPSRCSPRCSATRRAAACTSGWSSTSSRRRLSPLRRRWPSRGR